MNCKINVDINRGLPIWLSIEADSGTRTFQDFDITIEKAAAPERVDLFSGPGQVPSVILRDFSNIVAENDFNAAQLTYQDDENWSVKWNNGTDLCFTYANGTPFENGGVEYNFKWSNFYTLVSPAKDKKTTVRIEAHNISGCREGSQGSVTVRFGYPAHIGSFQPDEDRSSGIVSADLENGSCIVSRNGSVVLKWNCSSDFTAVVKLEEDDRELPGTFKMTDSYNTGPIVSDKTYKLTVRNSYNIPVERTFRIYKTDWKKEGEEEGIFKDDIYGETHYNTKIFLYEGNYYFYLHPYLYKRENNNWEVIAENKLYLDSDKYICRASYLYDGVLHVMGIKNLISGCFCKYDLSSGKWETEITSSWHENPQNVWCGYYFSDRNPLFYDINNDKSFYILKMGYSDSQYILIPIFHSHPPENMKFVSGDVCLHNNEFYAAMICESLDESRGKYAYLRAVSDPCEYIMKI